MKWTWKTMQIPWLARPCWCGEVECQRKSHSRPSRRSDASRKRQSDARKTAWRRKKNREFWAEEDDKAVAAAVAATSKEIKAAWANADGQMAKKDETKGDDQPQ